MNTRRKKMILLLFMILLISIALYIIWIAPKIQLFSNESDGLDSTEFVWSEEFEKTNADLTVEDKKRLYIETTALTLEKNILNGIDKLNDVSIEINKTDEVTDVNIKLDMDSDKIIDEKEIDGILNLVLKSIEGLSKENIKMIDQNGNEIK
ncbi:hypothetical protein [Fusibacter sp. 3D3]|uniref:hypothetical protein n=1 Tax=Fusibacter sp. 3D3 TaxID=1048380 RepID=UPI000852D9FF|nr:hypothetical protein [Fusibacter sp. 3D3]